MLRTLTRLTQPAVEPVSLEELKLHVRATSEEDHSTLTRMEKTARDAIERWIGRSLIEQQWELSMDGSPGSWTWGYTYKGRVLELGMPPLVSVQSVKYFTETDAEQAFSSSNYNLDLVNSRLWLKNGVSWPAALRPYRSLVVSFTAGYGTTAASVPEPIRHAILLLVAHLWEHREAVSDSSSTNFIPQAIPMGIRELLGPFNENLI